MRESPLARSPRLSFAAFYVKVDHRQREELTFQEKGGGCFRPKWVTPCLKKSKRLAVPVLEKSVCGLHPSGGWDVIIAGWDLKWMSPQLIARRT